MIKISEKPHLENVIDKLIEEGFKNITLCLNYKYKYIINYFKKTKKKANISYSIEKKNLEQLDQLKLQPIKIPNILW